MYIYKKQFAVGTKIEKRIKINLFHVLYLIQMYCWITRKFRQMGNVNRNQTLVYRPSEYTYKTLGADGQTFNNS